MAKEELPAAVARKPPQPVKFQMYLDDRKVGRRYGTSAPTLGISIPGHEIIVQAGFQWSESKEEWIKPDLKVQRKFTLRRIKKGLWEVSVDAVARERVTSMLFNLM